jgi:LacI family transcriptional regulator
MNSPLYAPATATITQWPGSAVPVISRSIGGYSALPKVLVVVNTSFGDSEALLNGIARFQRDNGDWDMFVDFEGRAEADSDWFSGQPWRGVISRTTSQLLVDRCAARKIPLVDLNDSTPFAGVPKIRPDNIAIGHLAAEDLYSRGFRHLYYCGYSNQNWALERRDGFFEALYLLGCRPQEFSLPVGAGANAAENAAIIDQIAGWLKTLPRPAGIMAAHDMRGRQILDASQQLGINVPEELAVIGVNNDEVRCEFAFPTLTSVAVNHQRAGYLAAEQLTRLMTGTGAPVHDIRIEPVRIVTRNSTDSLPIEDRDISAALSIIRQEACLGITVEEVVRRAAVPRARLERGFRALLGRSPHAEIRRMQLLKIKQLLTETEFPLKQIAALTGFEHVEYLSVSFKRAVGETPGRFRRTARENAVTCKSLRENALASPAA